PPIRDKTNATVSFSHLTTSPKILRLISKYHYKSIAATGREEPCSQTKQFIRGHPFHPRSFPHGARLLRKVPCQAGDQGRGRGEAEERQARDEGQVSRVRHDDHANRGCEVGRSPRGPLRRILGDETINTPSS